jgi:2-polyprenyl-3-methyl-5-hydroxy-6-metoxy-1,4-benzoquinol methylase
MNDAEYHIHQLVWTDELIRRFWDGFSHTHLENLSFGKLAGPQFLEFIREYLPAGGEICDYGAGSGHLAELLIKAGFATAIYEPSPGRAEALQRRLSPYGSFTGVVGSEDRRQFDLLIMAEVIEHLPGHVLDQTLERIRGLLRPGGTLIVTTPNNENLGDAQVFCPVCQQTFHPWQHVRNFTHESLEKQLNEYGFASRFIGLVDFSNYAAAIECSRLFSTFVEFMRLLDEELVEFVQHLPPVDARNAQSGWAAGSVYATDNLQFDHRLILAEIAKLRAQTKAQIREISWLAVEDTLPAALTQLCDEFYSWLGLLIGAQQSLAQIQQLKSIIADIVGRFHSVDRAVSGIGIGAQLEPQGLGFLKSPGSRIYWAARFCWEFLRHPASLAEVIRMPRVLADHARAVSAIGSVAEPNAPVETRPGMPDAGAVSAVRVPQAVIVNQSAGEDKAAACGGSGATEAVCVHLSSIAERMQHALGTFATSRAKLRAELGYDVFLGRGSTILYIGEKI